MYFSSVVYADLSLIKALLSVQNSRYGLTREGIFTDNTHVLGVDTFLFVHIEYGASLFGAFGAGFGLRFEMCKFLSTAVTKRTLRRESFTDEQGEGTRYVVVCICYALRVLRDERQMK